MSQKIHVLKRKLVRFARKHVTPRSDRSIARKTLIAAIQTEGLVPEILKIREICWDELIDWVLDRSLYPDQYGPRDRWRL